MRFLRPPFARALRIAAVVAALVVPLLTLPSLPHVSLWPALLGLLPWTLGKYVLCPLRWHALSESGRGRRWHLGVYAESELFGLLSPGHVGADLWRIHRLKAGGLPRASAFAELGVDRFVGAIGLAVFVGFAGAALPVRMLVGAIGLAVAVLVG